MPPTISIHRRNRLVEKHAGMVPPIARSVAAQLPASFDLDDLEQTGYLGLMRAADRYRPKAHNNTPFEPYARPIVRGAMLDSTRRRHYTNATFAALDGQREQGCPATVEVSIDTARRAKRIHGAVTWMLPETREVIALHYGVEDTLRQVGKVLEISKGKASRIHLEALRELRGILRLRVA